MTAQTFTAFTATLTDGKVERSVGEIGVDDLQPDGALIAVSYSSVNYKDGLASTADGKVARISPIVPGIDLSGTIVELDEDAAARGLQVGDQVIAHGYDIGVSRHGGFAQLARVPGAWLVPLPDGLELRDAMVIGTAGFTAALSVVELGERGLRPGDGPVLVTGATGGVGSTAVAMLARLGHEVVASTGKPESEAFLKELGAASIIDRNELSAESRKPLNSMDWAAAVDCVGGTTLANVLTRIRYGGAVAASGLTGGAALPTTVLPFILRGVALLGIDSVQTAIERRVQVWQRIATDLKPANIDKLARDVTLDELSPILDAILAGAMVGRAVVNLRA